MEPSKKKTLQWSTHKYSELTSAVCLGSVKSIKAYGAAKLMHSTGGRQQNSQAVMVLLPPAQAVFSTRANGITHLKMCANAAVVNKVRILLTSLILTPPTTTIRVSSLDQ